MGQTNIQNRPDENEMTTYKLVTEEALIAYAEYFGTCFQKCISH